MAEARTSDASGTVRVGLIGYGLGGASFHAPFLATTPGVELAAIVTGDTGRQALARERHPATAIVATADELLARDDIDLVVVSTPNLTHVPLATAALRSGRHVVVDKPVAPSADGARRLRTEAEDHGRLCIPFHNRRWDGDFRTVRHRVDGGHLGRLRHLEIRWERWRPQVDARPERAWKDDPDLGSATGVHLDLGPHVIDQALVLMGRPTAVHAELRRTRPGARVVDDAFLSLAFADDATAHLTTSLAVGRPLPRFRAIGTEATYVGVTTMDPQEDALVAGRSPAEPGWGDVDPSAWGTIGAGGHVEAVPTLPGDYGAFYRGVARAVVDGDPPPVTIDDAVAVMAVLDAARRSADERAVVAVKV